ncbi:MAG: hypothetical protein FWF59_07565 [Turicibacter sp.]|nr:hypothetical protein [Turicibacter sp.]
MVKKCIKSILILLAISLAIFHLLATNPKHAIRLNGYVDIGRIIQHGRDLNGREFKIIQTFTRGNNDAAFLHLNRNGWGHWHIIRSERLAEDSTWLIFTWFGGQSNFQIVEGRTIFNWQSNQLVYGTNAIKMLENLEELLPHGVSVSISQSNSEFVIHLQSYREVGDDEASISILSTFDLQGILVEHGFIE